jgi:ADP-heptose:LPS heptosyltransferase
MEEGTPHTFIDHHHPLEELKKFEPFCVILRGCSRHNLAANGQGALFERKDPGTAIYQLILKDLLRKGITPILLGTDGDLPQLKEIVKDQPNTVLILNSMKKSLAAIKQSVGVIANDTGLYHASVALRKKTFVLWKNTPFEKNRAPGEEATFAFENNYKASYYHWIEEIKK